MVRLGIVIFALQSVLLAQLPDRFDDNEILTAEKLNMIIQEIKNLKSNQIIIEKGEKDLPSNITNGQTVTVEIEFDSPFSEIPQVVTGFTKLVIHPSLEGWAGCAVEIKDVRKNKFKLKFIAPAYDFNQGTVFWLAYGKK